MNSDLSLEEASKRLEISFKDTESRLDVIGEKVDSVLQNCQKETGRLRIKVTSIHCIIYFNSIDNGDNNVINRFRFKS